MALSGPQETALLTLLNTSFPALVARVLALEKHEGMNVEDHTPAVAPTIPTDAFTVGEVDYKFTAGNFYHKGVLYVSADIMDDVEGNSDLLDELVAAQTDGETFVPGLLEIVEGS